MNNTRLAYRYAKSIIELSIERNQLEVINADMKYLQAVCKLSPEFKNLLASPIVKSDKKQSIINAVTIGKINELTVAFLKLLVVKGREGDLFEIANSFLEQYNEIKDIHKVTITTAVPISEELQESIKSRVSKARNFGSVELETKLDASILGGFVLEFDNRLVDASIVRDLNDVRKQFLKNYYASELS